jgi:hypothetical protein
MAAMSASGHSRILQRKRDVRFGSKADICAAKSHVRFAPKTTAKADSKRIF